MPGLFALFILIFSLWGARLKSTYFQSNSRVIVICACLTIFLFSCDENPSVKNTCLQEDGVLGVLPKPGCRFTSTNSKGEKIDIAYNNFGLRDREFDESPEPGVIRVMVMGPRLDSDALSDADLPARQLDKNLKAMKVHNLEIINASVHSLRASGNALLAKRLVQAYHPLVVVYDQPGDAFDADYLESKGIRASTPFALAFERTKQHWRLRASGSVAATEFLKPTIKGLRDIGSLLGPYGHVFVVWDTQAAEAWTPTSGLNGFFNILMRFATPTLTISKVDLFGGLIAAGGLTPFPTPEINKIDFLNEKTGSLTSEGAAAWAESIGARLGGTLVGMPRDPSRQPKKSPVRR